MPGKLRVNKRNCFVTFVMLLLWALCSTVSYAATDEQINDSVNKGTQWLIQVQNPDGNWGDNTKKDILDTAEIAKYLVESGQAPLSVDRAVYWLQSQDPSNNDFSARVMPFMTAQAYDETLSALIACQNPDGGWGLAEGYDSDILDTVIVLNALMKEDRVDISIIQKGLAFIIRNQNSDGSWPYVKNGTGSVSLTAQASLLLNSCSLKTVLSSEELSLVLQRAGEYLVSQNLAEPARYAEETLAGTLLAYRAALNSVGSGSLGAVEDTIFNTQLSDGSWYNDPYLTLLAMRALREKNNAVTAAIDRIELYKPVINDELEEAYSFNAYESVIIKVYGQYGSTAKLQVFVRTQDGLAIASESGGQFIWDTINKIPGEYSVIAQLKDTNSGIVLTSAEKQFDIQPSFNIGEVTIRTNPPWARVGNPTGVDVYVSLFNQSNIDRQVDVTTEVYGSDGAVITSASKSVSCTSPEQFVALKMLSFVPDVSVEKEYEIRTFIYDNQIQVNEGLAVFKVLPLPSPIRVDVGQNLDKTLLYPANDDVTATFTLTGEGTDTSSGSGTVISFYDDYFSDSGLWEYIGSARRENGYVVLVPAITRSGGQLWLNQPISSPLTVEFEYLIGGGSGADGIVLMFDKKKAFGGTGGTLGFGDKGYGIEFDCYYNGEYKDPSGRHIALIEDSVSNHLLYKDDPRTEDNIWHHTRIEVEDSSIRVYVDDEQVLSWNGTIDRTYNNLGFSAATGSATNNHYIRNVRISTDDNTVFSGKNVVVTTTLPVNGMAVDTALLQPVPDTIVNNPDGSKTLSWQYDKINIGQKETIPIKFAGSSLAPDTMVVLTNSTRLTYQDNDDNLVAVDLPDLTIPVSNTSISTSITTDKQQYTPNEQAVITVNASNLSDSGCTLTGLVEITDMDGNIAAVVSPAEEVSWVAGETKTLSHNWNIGKVFKGIYKVRVTWSEENKVISSSEVPFEIVSDGGIINTVFTDKITYTANETVGIQEIVINTSTNAIMNDLTVSTQVYGQGGFVDWNKRTTIPEILPGASWQYKSSWGVAQAVYGDYSVVSTVYQGDLVLCQDSAKFSVSSSVYSGQGITGNLDVLTKNICPGDDVTMEYTLTNRGNTELQGVLIKITIAHPATGEVVDTITHTVSLAVNDTFSDLVIWSHDALKPGNYLVVCDVTLDDEVVVPLDSSYFIVKEPYGVTMQRVVRPRVLVWAESQFNINMATNVLNEMQVYYRIVNNRDAFFAELQSGKYNTYVMLNKSLPLTDHDDLVLAGEIAGGKGLVATGGSNGDNLKQFNLFGIKEIGSVNSKGYTTSFIPGSPLGEFALYGTGTVQRVLITGGQEIASIITQKVTLPGVVTHLYGEGKTVLMTFDLGEAGPAADAYTLFRNSLERVAPVQETQGNVAEVEIRVQATGAVEAMLKEEFPAGTEILWVSPELTSADPPSWQFSTAPGQEYTFRYVVRLPGAGSMELPTCSYYLEAEEYKLLKTISLIINVP